MDGFDPSQPPTRPPGPPRYVPTLTDVVQAAPEPAGGSEPPGFQEEAPVAPPIPAYLARPLPPPPADAVLATDPVPDLPQPDVFQDMPASVARPEDDEERVLRVLQRVEVLLDRRMAAAVAQAADSMSRAFASRLQSELEPLVREVVREAVAEEWSRPRPPPA